MALELTHFTDPACPFAFSAEPVRLALRWHYGEQLRWTTRMIVLTLEPGEAEKLAEGAAGLQRRYGMPIDPAPVPAAGVLRAGLPRVRRRAAERARGRGPAAAPPARARDARRAARRARADRGGGRRCGSRSGRAGALERDRRGRAGAAGRHRRGPVAGAGGARARPQARRPGRAAALHRAELRDRRRSSVPGFNPVEAYETAIANLAPDLTRRPKPATVEELLAWAGEPLATAEVAAVARLDPVKARVALGKVARPLAAGADFYWTLD